MGRAIGIAGVGAVSSAGRDVAGTLEAFWEGRRAPAAGLPFECAVACPTFQVEGELAELPGRANRSRTVRLAMQAVREALADAGLEEIPAGTRVGVCLGTTVASQLNNIAFYDAWRRGARPGLEPVHDYLAANLAQAVGKILQATGPRMTVVNACSSGTDAVGVAAGWVRAGLCDLAIVGGADELNRVPMAGFWSLGVMSGEACAPFDRDRTGLNLGEGAGVLVLEVAEHARGRGAIHDFGVAGFGASCDAHHLTAPHPEGRGLDSAIRAAMGQAGIAARDIGFINAHGTATLDNDRAEGKVIARLFPEGVPFLSTKGYTGHTLGAAGGLEAVFTLLGLREGWVPGSAGFRRQAEDLAIAPVRERTVISGRYALSTSLAFGGNNAALVIGKLD